MADHSSRLNDTEMATVRQHVDSVLASQTLIQADRLRRFLEYIVDHTLSGQTDRLSQFSIAIDVFDRDESFDPVIDAIVRVEAGRLRSKLLQYYDDEGREDLVRISLPKNSYAVRFRFGEQHSTVAPADLNRPPTRLEALAPIAVTHPTIAVLPFDNMSADPEQEYFSDGFTEDLTTDLARLPGLSVIARQSSFTYKGIATNARNVSTQLGAEFIVEGSVRKIGHKIRINAQLIHGKTGKHIWAERFDCEIDDIFELQDRVNRKIVDALRRQISSVNQSRLQSKGKGTKVVEAHDYLLRGIQEADRHTREGSTRARYCFRSALGLDPNYAVAYGRLSLNAVYQWIAGWNVALDETVERGVELAEKAVALDAGSAFVHGALCWALLWRGEHNAAIIAGTKATKIDPNDVVALERLAFSLAWSTRAEEALQSLAKAQILNPLHGYHFLNGVCYFVLERYSVAVESLRSSINANPTFLPSYLYLAATLSLLDQPENARSVVQLIKQLDPDYHPAKTRHVNFKSAKDKDRFIGAITRVIGN